jgi:hypothetical protein
MTIYHTHFCIDLLHQNVLLMHALCLFFKSLTALPERDFAGCSHVSSTLVQRSSAKLRTFFQPLWSLQDMILFLATKIGSSLSKYLLLQLVHKIYALHDVCDQRVV